MPVTSVVVEVIEGVNEDLLGRIARIPRVNVFGMKGQQIVTVIEGDNVRDVEDVVRTILEIEGVIGVYPVYSGDYE
ncbi:MAG: chaperone NapD [Nitrospirota bacterium]|nr:chaperone NapD [Nitrospirota bacterium]